MKKYKIKHKIRNGAEILIHIGMDTVQLNGEHFTAHVKEGDKVNVGDLLVEFDIKEIEKAGYSVVTPIIVTNSNEYGELEITEGKNVKKEAVLIITKK